MACVEVAYLEVLKHVFAVFEIRDCHGRKEDKRFLHQDVQFPVDAPSTFESKRNMANTVKQVQSKLDCSSQHRDK